jgi:chromosome segregation ATPase
VVFVAGLFAAPFAQYYLGPRLAELSGIADLAAGRGDPIDFSRLRDVEQRTEQLSNAIESVARAEGPDDARVAALENEVGLLREDLKGLSALTERTASLESSSANLSTLEARLSTLEAQQRDQPGDIAAMSDRLASVDETLAAARAESAQLADTVESRRT